MANTYIIRTLYAGTTTASPTGTPNMYLTGPSGTGSFGTKGLYICESRTGSSPNQTITYRYQEDMQTLGVAPPSSYAALGI